MPWLFHLSRQPRDFAILLRQPMHDDNAWKLLTDLLRDVEQSTDLDELAQTTLSTLARYCGGRWLIARRRAGVWSAWFGESNLLEPLSRAVEPTSDDDAWTHEGHRFVLLDRSVDGLAVVHEPTDSAGAPNEKLWTLIVAVWRLSWQFRTRIVAQQVTGDRSAAMLDIVWRWAEHRDVGSLWEDLANSATRLLHAERASVFLWDRPRKQLVARPALGVEGGELRIPDDQGVVGAVVQSATARRVDSDDAHEIDRAVDEEIGFHTRNLACVPLVSTRGDCVGAFELINKKGGDFTDTDLRALEEMARYAGAVLATAQDHGRLLQTREQVAQEAAAKVQVIGQSSAMEALRNTVSRVADTELALLILGENGTGKDVISQQVHYLSSRRNEPFVAVNCAAISETLLESELFGHEKGAFTDARDSRAGKFELASRGTLFLDEIGELSVGGQAKLLRVLEEKVVVRVGGSLPIPADARIIAATNQDLAQLVRDGKFREDLFFRLNVVTIRIPPLRDRPDDVLELAEHFLKLFSTRARRALPEFTPAARNRLRSHHWPGNVRELRNLMERLAYLVDGPRIDVSDLDFVGSPSSAEGGLWKSGLGLADATRRFQVGYIRRQVQASQGNLSEAADRLGMHRSNLYRKMKQLGMDEDPDAHEVSNSRLPESPLNGRA